MRAPVIEGEKVKDYNEYLKYLKKNNPGAVAALNYTAPKRKCR